MDSMKCSCSALSSEEAVRLIENLAFNNNTKNTDFERKKSATTLEKEQLDDVQAKMDSVHKLLKKQVNFAEDVEAADVDSDLDGEEDVMQRSLHSLTDIRMGFWFRALLVFQVLDNLDKHPILDRIKIIYAIINSELPLCKDTHYF